MNWSFVAFWYFYSAKVEKKFQTTIILRKKNVILDKKMIFENNLGKKVL